MRALELTIILIKHFSGFLPHAADPETALRHFSRFATEMMARPNWAEEFATLDRPEVLDALVRVLGESEFLWTDYLRDQAELILPLINDPSTWDRTVSMPELEAELTQAVNAADGTEDRRRAIRRVRDREVFRAGLRGIVGKATPDRFAAEMTAVAEAVIRASYRQALDRGRVRGRAPVRRRGLAGCRRPSAPWASSAGEELGFGSDLELIVVYDDCVAADALAASDYFDAVVRGLRAVMGVQIGGTFELDFRLRPYGKGGPPATSLTYLRVLLPAGRLGLGVRAPGADPAPRRCRAIRALSRRVEAHRDRFVYGPEPFDLGRAAADAGDAGQAARRPGHRQRQVQSRRAG